jgi:glycosyltransferase involved in cell wall biosynthesis
MEKKIAVVIPTFNEAQAIGDVVRAVPVDDVQEIIVVDNASVDDTARQAALAGARVVHEPRRGYGSACLAGAKAARSDIIVFLDGDRSDDPRQIGSIAGPVVQDQADLVIGSRIGGRMEKGAMPLHGKLGNHLIIRLLRLLYGLRISDIGSFRAIRTDALFELKMEQMTYGWPVEMVIKAARKKLRIESVPISYRRRIGRSKVTGTFIGSMAAGYHMFWVPLKYIWKE